MSDAAPRAARRAQRAGSALSRGRPAAACGSLFSPPVFLSKSNHVGGGRLSRTLGGLIKFGGNSGYIPNNFRFIGSFMARLTT
jgi:hypothetical protein